MFYPTYFLTGEPLLLPQLWSPSKRPPLRLSPDQLSDSPFHQEQPDGAESEPMAGFDDYLIKPIDPPTLLSKIQVLPTGRVGGDP
ncbi:MAG: hypothetical protein AAF226_00725, partial [Verrucomicrobiota bacterium]